MELLSESDSDNEGGEQERSATKMMILDVRPMRRRGYKRKSRSGVERDQTARVASSLSKP